MCGSKRDAESGAVTYPPPHQPPGRPGFWQRRSPLQRAGLIVAALILPCCGGMAVIGALTGDPKTETVTGTGTNLADVQPIATTEAAPAVTTTPTATETTTPPAETTQAITETRPPVVKKTITMQGKAAYKTRRVNDSGLTKGKTRVRTQGVTGLKTMTYEVTYTGGKETARRLVRTVVTRSPVTRVIAVGTKAKTGGGNCHPSYRPCVPIASDVDCAGGDGNGPAYVDGPITVIGPDEYDLDRDNDGTACDS